MKLIILLTILILSFLSYYFFVPTNNKVKDIQIKKELPPIDSLKENHKKNDTLIYTKNENAIEQIQSPMKIKVDTQKEYLTLSDIKKKVKKETTTPQEVESLREEIFLQLKKILQQSSSTYYSKRSIALNSYMSILLSNPNAKEKFKKKMKNEFGLDEETIEENLKKNKTVWNWVEFLLP